MLAQSIHRVWISQFRRCSVSILGVHTSRSSSSTPRRAILYVPGNDEKKLLKIPQLNVDCVVMDCEDGVAANRKEEARTTICKMLDNLNFGRTEPTVRVNSVSSGLVEDDLNITLSAENLPPTIMLPKVEYPTELEWFSYILKKALSSRPEKPKLNLIIFIETAVGLLNMRDVCGKGCQLSESGPFNLAGLVFGSDDFVADIGATRTTDAKELLYARQNVVVTAKAFRLQAIDMVHIDFKDLDGLRQSSIEGALMGFTGKQVIHPNQVPVVQEAFSPTPEKIEWATELIKAFDEHQSSGTGAFTFRGHMIDMPLLLQAQNIIKVAEVIKGKT